MPTKTEITEFSELIENLNYELDVGYMETIIHHCEKSGLEVEVAATLLSPALKMKIQEEAENLNLVKTKARDKLPL
jgi:Phage late-transcription coactivator